MAYDTIQQSGAGIFIERVAFDKREVIDDGYGNVISGDWQEQLSRRAQFILMRGGETVMEGRLASRAPMVVRIRMTSQTKLIDTDWQMRDVRQGTAWNIREVRHDTARAVIDILVETNVNTG